MADTDRRRLMGLGLAAGAMLTGGAAWGQSSAGRRARAQRDRARRAAERAPPTVIPFRVTQNTPWTVVQFGDGEPLAFMLDINASILQAHPSVASAAGFIPQRVLGDMAEYGPVDFRMGGVQATATPLMTNARLFEGRVAVGSAPLMGFRRPFELDWDRQLLSFGELPEEAEGWTRLSGRAADWQWPTIEAELDGEPVRLGVETEVASGLTLFPSYFDRRGLWDHYERRRTDLDPEGEPFAQVVVGERLRVGEIELSQPLFRLKRGWDVFEAQHGVRGRGGPDGMIGFDVLKRLNVRCDWENDAIWFKPSAELNVPWLDDRAGLVLTARRGDTVVSVIDPASPAWRAGLRQGDFIVDYLGPGGLASLAWAVTQPAGSEVEIVYEREGVEGQQRTTLILEDRV